MLSVLKVISDDLLSLLYPKLCAACNHSLADHEQIICLSCELKLPYTNYHLNPENPIMQRFWGRLPLLHAASYYQFMKAGNVQNLLHQLKYRKHTEVGERIGQLYAQKLLLDESAFSQANLIIPIPLHLKKLRIRGYNQCDFFAKGLSKCLKIPWSNQMVERTIHTASQTGKNRSERWDNVENIFKAKASTDYEGKHIILVDDVVTTGSTLEACALTLMKSWGCNVSILTIASAI